MFLSQLLIINYRSCNKLIIEFKKDEPNIFIGINDCGKTSILKAIGLLLDDKPTYHFIKENSSKNDFSNSPISLADFQAMFGSLSLPAFDYTENQTIVVGKFVIENEDINSSELGEYSNLLLWAVENSHNNELWLAKSFESKSNTTRTFLLTKDISDSQAVLSKFYLLGVRELDKKILEHGVTKEEIQNENGKGRFSNLEKIRALYNKLGTSTLNWCDYKIEKGDKSVFPIYRYLDWNASLDEIKKVAGDAMAVLIEKFLTPVKKQANSKAIQAQSAVNKKLTSLKNTINELVPNVTALKTKVYFEVRETITDIFINKLNTDGDVHLDLQGEGVKRQIWFALIKSGALASIESGVKVKKFIWAFDEPETHLYPSAQRQFFDIIKQVSHTTVQSFISTHSTVFIDKSNISSIRSIFLNNSSYSDYAECPSIDSIFASLELRNSDFLFFDKFLVIEGDTEQHLIPELYKLYTKRTLTQDNVQLINLGGKDKWLNNKKSLEDVLNGFKKSFNYVIYVFDADMKYELGANAVKDNFYFVGKQDIEDAIDNSIWVSIVNHATEGKVKLKAKEIAEIKKQVPNDKAGQKNEKFYVLLEKKLKEMLSKKIKIQVTWNVLPGKGSDSASLISTNIKKERQIPQKIREAFDKINEGVH